MTRWRALVVLILALLTLTGCRVEGRVEVESVSSIAVDVTVHAGRSPYCSSDLPGLSTIPGVESGGVVTSCRYTGVVDPAEFGGVLSLATAGEYLVGVFNPLQVPAAGPRPGVANQLEQVDVTIVLPGEVVESNAGKPSGNEVRITDPEVLELPGGLRIVALNHPGPALWVWWLSGGVLMGAVAAVTVAAGVRRFGKAPVQLTDPDEPTPPDHVSVDEAGPAPRGPDDLSPSDPSGTEVASVWAGPGHDDADTDAKVAKRNDPAVWAPDD